MRYYLVTIFAVLSGNSSECVKNMSKSSDNWLGKSRQYYTASHLQLGWYLKIYSNNFYYLLLLGGNLCDIYKFFLVFWFDELATLINFSWYSQIAEFVYCVIVKIPFWQTYRKISLIHSRYITPSNIQPPNMNSKQ